MKKIILIFSAVLILGLSLLGCSPVADEHEIRIIKVGAVLPLTGEASSFGQSAKRAIELAQTEINQQTEFRLEINFEDSEIKPQKAVNAAQKLINTNQIKYVIGFGSDETLAMCPLTEEKQVVLLSSGSSPDIANKCGAYTFRNYPSDIYQGKILAQKIQAQGSNKIAVLHINNSYGSGLATEFEKNFNGEILITESHAPGAADFKTQLAKIKNKNPQAIVLLTYPMDGIKILKQKHELGLPQPVLASEALKDQSLLDSLNPEQLQNLQIISATQYQGPEYQTFQTNHLTRYGQGPGPYADYVYDNMWVLAKALGQCQDKYDTGCVKDKIYQTNFYGATGLVNFDANGDVVNKEYSLYTVEAGQFVLAE